MRPFWTVIHLPLVYVGHLRQTHQIRSDQQSDAASSSVTRSYTQQHGHGHRRTYPVVLDVGTVRGVPRAHGVVFCYVAHKSVGLAVLGRRVSHATNGNAHVAVGGDDVVDEEVGRHRALHRQTTVKVGSADKGYHIERSEVHGAKRVQASLHCPCMDQALLSISEKIACLYHGVGIDTDSVSISATSVVHNNLRAISANMLRVTGQRSQCIFLGGAPLSLLVPHNQALFMTVVVVIKPKSHMQLCAWV